ncbi:barstar family protein [Microbispora sp. RL4-1S]|uniref:Barstar family protein n=1 Tax=Microbispora oryzae TaxID=2806554 RepID=A0A940WE84_9ACTN|nr:barstar family protein [Microbispora oryzae]MBP2703013.1 barstar family protein [Microbispora oryzae]
MNARPLPSWLTVSADSGPDSGPDSGIGSDSGPASGFGSVPAVLDGRACRTRAGFFEEAARALHLPGYFGRNWDALSDSLRDAGPVTLSVWHAEDLLAAEPPGQFAALLAVLAVAAESGLTLALHTDEAGVAALRARVAEALA